MKFNIIRSKEIKSSNVDAYRYDTKTKELIITFNDGSKYKYYDVEYNDFENITYGDATCITEGENEYGSWYVGKSPSVGAAVWEFLINKNKKYEQMSRSLKKVDKDRLPVYEIVVDEFDETGMNLISIVENLLSCSYFWRSTNSVIPAAASTRLVKCILFSKSASVGCCEMLAAMSAATPKKV